jgi:hypothetical protein
MTAVCAPTVNAYKRFVAQELGPYFVDWGTDNRSVCVRIPAERGEAARVESRIADGGASAYLASAVQIFAGVDGVARELDPGPPTERVYEPPVEREIVPLSLGEALDALEADSFTRTALGEQFMLAFSAIKRNEWRRFQLAVTDWELREYADALYNPLRRPRAPAGSSRARRRDREPRGGRIYAGRAGEPPPGTARLAGRWGVRARSADAGRTDLRRELRARALDRGAGAPADPRVVGPREGGGEDAGRAVSREAR